MFLYRDDEVIFIKYKTDPIEQCNGAGCGSISINVVRVSVCVCVCVVCSRAQEFNVSIMVHSLIG